MPSTVTVIPALRSCGDSCRGVFRSRKTTMAPAKVINDLHYNGKTVNERLASQGLLEQFQAATEAQASDHMIQLLEQVAIARTWATQLVAAILKGPPQAPIQLNLGDPRNAGPIRYFERRNELQFPRCMRAAESPRDPYLHLGSHPDVVEYVWDQLGVSLPGNCRCIVFGTPALVAPTSGILLAQAFGTQYVLRVALQSMSETLARGAKTRMTWAGGQTTDLAREYSDDWIFGCWAKEEPTWLRAVYDAVENAS